MKNYVQPGDVLTLTAPANVSSGALVAVGQIIGVAAGDALTATNVQVKTTGVFSGLRALNGASTSAAVGANAYFDATNSNVTISATSNAKIGVFMVAKANADTSATIRLNGTF